MLVHPSTALPLKKRVRRPWKSVQIAASPSLFSFPFFSVVCYAQIRVSAEIRRLVVVYTRCEWVVCHNRDNLDSGARPVLPFTAFQCRPCVRFLFFLSASSARQALWELRVCITRVVAKWRQQRWRRHDACTAFLCHWPRFALLSVYFGALSFCFFYHILSYSWTSSPFLFSVQVLFFTSVARSSPAYSLQRLSVRVVFKCNATAFEGASAHFPLSFYVFFLIFLERGDRIRRHYRKSQTLQGAKYHPLRANSAAMFVYTRIDQFEMKRVPLQSAALGLLRLSFGTSYDE